jgi:hypothetical protein
MNPRPNTAKMQIFIFFCKKIATLFFWAAAYGLGLISY